MAVPPGCALPGASQVALLARHSGALVPAAVGPGAEQQRAPESETKRAPWRLCALQLLRRRLAKRASHCAGVPPPLARAAAAKPPGGVAAFLGAGRRLHCQTKKRGRTPHVDLVDAKLNAILEARSGRDYMAVREFLMNLAVNHEVVVRREKTKDRLQKGVAQTIIAMIRAGIKVWMLTGDKVETAINIGIATGLLEPESAEDKGDRPILTAQDFTIAGQFQHEQFAAQLTQLAKEAADASDTGHMYEGLVIDGRCLEAALMKECEQSFVDVCKVCKTVLCCRVSPKQKGAVVRLIKGSLKAVTLAIGDGANDCNMIQSADVGIGIRGKEGLQAFNVCDYGISQFRFLQNLLLVHGRWCYRRMAILVNYTFYKNVVVVMAQYFMGSVSQKQHRWSPITGPFARQCSIDV